MIVRGMVKLLRKNIFRCFSQERRRKIVVHHMPIIRSLLSLKYFWIDYEVETWEVVAGKVDLLPPLFLCVWGMSRGVNTGSVLHPSPIDTKCCIKTLILKSLKLKEQKLAYKTTCCRSHPSIFCPQILFSNHPCLVVEEICFQPNVMFAQGQELLLTIKSGVKGFSSLKSTMK